MNVKFYAISGFDHGCVTGGHTVNSETVVWRPTVGGRLVGVQTCSDCGATRKVLEYAKEYAKRKR